MSNYVEERDALHGLLSEGLFDKAPNLQKVLVFLCEKTFLGQTGEIKEYTIATEALGRASSFDQKRDSIVRVEIHRLRKRLKQYYESQGARTPIHIEIPEGSYVPAFRRIVQPVHPPAEEARAPNPSPPVAPSKRSRKIALIVAGATALALVASAGFVLRTRSESPGAERDGAPAGRPTNNPPPSEPGRGVPPGDEIRILAGRPPGRYVDRYGRNWEGDRYFTGGEAIESKGEVATQGFDSNIFLGAREGDFRYDIPLRPGVYEFRFIFAEMSYGEGNPHGGGIGSRISHVDINGKRRLENIDIIGDAIDPGTATMRVLKDVSPAADGMAHVAFVSTPQGKPLIHAIHIKPGVPGKLRPIRIVCSRELYHDKLGAAWEPDQFYRGGIQIQRPQGPATADEPNRLKGERYGHFTYAIPVTPGKYGVRLYFWEYWWGKGRPGEGGVGSRVFDVYSNYQPLIQRFDILRETGTQQAVVKTFHGLEPDTHGKISLAFVPRTNFALLNALEVFDETEK